MNKLQEITLEEAVRSCIEAGPVDSEDSPKANSYIINVREESKDVVYRLLLGCVEALELEELFLSKIASGVVTVESSLNYRRERLLDLNADSYVRILFEDIEIKQAISEGAKEITIVEPCRDWFDISLNDTIVETMPDLEFDGETTPGEGKITITVLMKYKGGCTLTGEQMFKQIDFIKENFVAGKYHLKLESATGNDKLVILIDRESVTQFIAEAREKQD